MDNPKTYLKVMIMKIAKLLKIQHKDTPKAEAARQAIAVAVIDNVDSAHAITRVVHAKSNTRWTASDEKLLVASFAEAVKDAGRDFEFLNRKQRKVVIQQAASSVKRSTVATKIRLKALGEYPSGARG